MSVTFSGDPTRKRLGNTVIRRGKIFEVGDYPDKGFSMTKEDVERAIAQFKAVPIGVEHRASIFDGKLGELFHIELHENGSDVMGEWAMPTWFDEVVGDEDISVSTEWDIATKTLKQLDTAVTPRVSDAAMKAAFAAFTNENKEKTVMSKLFDWLSGKTPEERETLTQEQIIAQFSESNPASVVTTPVVTTPVATPATTVVAASAATSNVPSVAEFASMQQQIAQLTDEKRINTATEFVKSMVREARILPAQQNEWIARLSRDMRDDEEKRGTVTFSNSENKAVEVPSSELTKKLMQSLPKHSLFSDHSLDSVPEGSVLLSASAAGGKSAHDQGFEFGADWAKRNAPYVESNNGQSK